MQTRRAILENTLHLRDEQIALCEKRPDGQLVRARALPQDAAGQIDSGEGKVREERGGEIDFPALGLDFDDAADDEVADFGGVARAQGADGEELVGFLEGACYGGEDGGGGGGVGAVAAGGWGRGFSWLFI